MKNHSVVVDKAVNSGAKLSNSPEYSQVVQNNTNKLTEAWAELVTAIQNKDWNELQDKVREIRQLFLLNSLPLIMSVNMYVRI